MYNQDLFLNCSTANLPPGTTEEVLVQWNQNGAPITQKASVYSNGTLLVPTVDRSDMGNYTCLVLDSRQNVVLTSDPAVVFHACKGQKFHLQINLHTMENSVEKY